MTEVVKFVPNRPDHEVAADLRRRMAEALQPVAAMLDEAEDTGFKVHFRLGRVGALGKHHILELVFAKEFT